MMFYQVFVLSTGIVAYALLKRLRIRKDKLIISLDPVPLEKANAKRMRFEDFAKDMLIAGGFGLYRGRALEKAAYEKLGIARCGSKLIGKRTTAKEIVLFARDYDELASCLLSRCSLLHAYLANCKIGVVYA